MSLQDDRVDIEELKAQAERLEYGPAKAALLEEIIRLVDLHGTEVERATVRWKYIHSMLLCGREDHFLLLFTQMLAIIDRDPESYSQFAVIDYYPVAISFARLLPDLPLDRISELLSDFERRARAFGDAERFIQYVRVKNMVSLGADRGVVSKEYDRYLALPLDQFTQDQNYFLERETTVLEYIQDYPKAIRTMEKVDPFDELLLRLYWKTSRFEKLERVFRSVYRKIQKSNDKCFGVDHLIWFSGVSHNWRIGKRLIERYWQRHTTSQCADTRFCFYARSAVFLKCWLVYGPKCPKTVRASIIPNAFSSPSRVFEAGEIDASELQADCWKQATQIAHLYDKRNRSNKYADLLSEMKNDVASARPFPITVR